MAGIAMQGIQMCLVGFFSSDMKRQSCRRGMKNLPNDIPFLQVGLFRLLFCGGGVRKAGFYWIIHDG